MHIQYKDPRTGSPKRNAVVLNVINSNCTFIVPHSIVK